MGEVRTASIKTKSRKAYRDRDPPTEWAGTGICRTRRLGSHLQTQNAIQPAGAEAMAPTMGRSQHGV